MSTESKQNNFYLVTGTAGTGKSTIQKELVARGYCAVDTDTRDISSFFNKETGNEAPRSTWNGSNKEWADQHSWRWKDEEIRRLEYESEAGVVILCGTSGNINDYLDKFRRVFLLTLSDEVLAHRILTRTNNNFGKGDGQLEQILGWKHEEETFYATYGAIAINSEQPITKVADEILSNL